MRVPTSQANTGSCVELITNGSFESGTAPWQFSSAGGYALISQLQSHTGAWGVYLGGYDSADDLASQQIALPGASAIALRFWWRMTTEETSHPWDTLDTNITLSDSTTTRLLRITDGDVAGIWQESVLDLSPYAGQSVRLAFRAQTDQDGPTDFYLDDVSVEACSVQATPSSTPATPSVPSATTTPTSQPSATPTVTVSPGASRVYLPVILR